MEEKEERDAGKIWSTCPKFPAHSLFLSFIPQNRRKQMEESEHLVMSNLKLSLILPGASFSC